MKVIPGTMNKMTMNRYLYIILYFFVLQIQPAFSQNFLNTVNGPYGGSVNDFARKSTGEIYAATNGGPYLNNGGIWQKVNDPNYDWTNTGLNGVVINNLDYIYYLQWNQIHISKDGGTTWTTKNFDNVSYSSGMSISISPSTNYIFIGTYNNGIFRSTDYGDTWTQFTDVQGLINYNNLYFGKVIEAGGWLIVPAWNYSYPGGVYYSSDWGNSWTFSNSGFNLLSGNDPQVRELTNIGNTIFAAVYGVSLSCHGVYRSDDYGNSWYLVNGSSSTLPNTYVTNIASDIWGVLLVNTYSGMYYSNDYGSNWYSGGFGLTVLSTLGSIFIDKTSGIVYTSTANGPYYSGDGYSFNLYNQGMHAQGTRNVRCSNTGYVFATTETGDIFRTPDEGSSWQIISPDASGSTSIDVNASDGSLYAEMNDGYLYVSNNNGDSWTNVSSIGYAYSLEAFNYYGTNYILYGGYNGIWLSTNGGYNWTQTYIHDDISYGYTYVKDIIFDPNSLYVYAVLNGSTGGFLRSSDGGNTWEYINGHSGTGLPVPFNGSNITRSGTGKLLMIGGGEGLYESTDNGSSWTQVPRFANSYPNMIKAFPNGQIYFSLGRDLYRSVDDGSNWDYMQNIPAQQIADIDISVNNYLYAGTYNSGLLRSANPVNSGYLNDLTSRGDYQSYAPFSSSSVSWADFNRDGYLDFAVAGNDKNGIYRFQIYRNNGDNYYYLQQDLTGFYAATVRWFDYDNDGYPDLMGTGVITDGTPQIFLYHNETYQGAGFADISSGNFTGLNQSTFDFGDINGDGWNDIVLIGRDPGTAEYKTIVYFNNRDKSFTPDYSLPGLANGAVSVMDIDRDGRNEIFITGYNGSFIISYLYYFDSNSKAFYSPAYSGLPALMGNDIASLDWGDFDQDGYLDLAIIGYDGTNYQCYIYRQQSTYNFYQYAYLSPSATNNSYSGSVQWGDYDLDGDLDLLTSSALATNIYSNNAGDFSGTPTTLPGVWYGQARFGDIEFDGDLDILTTANIYQNLSVKANTDPMPPASTTKSHLSGNPDAINISWNNGTDNETFAALTYNVEVFNSSFYGDMIIDPNSGEYYNKSAVEGISSLKGNANSNQIILNPTGDKNVLPIGTYYYQIQTVDAAFATSAWTPLDTFNIAYFPPNAPTNLQASLTDYTNVNLNWSDNSPDETGFSIERASANSPWAELGTMGQDVVAASDGTGTVNSTYYYRVRAYDLNGYSAYSNIVTVQTLSGNIGEPSQWAFATSVNGPGETLVRDLDFAFNNNNYVTGSYVQSCVNDQPIVDLQPLGATDNQQITIVYDAAQGSGNLMGVDKVYIHMGLNTVSYDDIGWSYIVGNWGVDDGIGLMTKVPGTDNKWSITLQSIRQYFNVPIDTPIYRLTMVFRNADGSRKGAGTPGYKSGNVWVRDNGDIYVDVNRLAPSATTDNDFYFAEFSNEGNLNMIRDISAHPDEERGIQTVVDTLSRQQYFLLSYADSLAFVTPPLVTQASGVPEFAILAYGQDMENPTPLWVKKIGATGYYDNIFMEHDQNGNLILTGNMLNGFYFGNNEVYFSSFDPFNSFFLNVDKNGNYYSGSTFLYSPYNSKITGMTVDESGYTYVAGYFSGWATIGGTTYYNSFDYVNGRTLFVIKLDSYGNCKWVRLSDETGYTSTTTKIAVSINTEDPDRGIFLAGQFFDTLRFNALGINSPNSFDGFVTKMDMNGNPLWIQPVGNKVAGYDDGVTDLAIDPIEGSVYITGYFSGYLNFPMKQLTGFGGADIFVAKFWGSGDFVWAEKAGGANSEMATNIRLGKDNTLYVAGLYNGGAPAFGNIYLTSYYNDNFSDVFLAKLNQTSNYTLPDLEVKINSVTPAILDTLNPTVTINYILYNHGDIQSPSTTLRATESFDHWLLTTVNDNFDLGDFNVDPINPGDSAIYSQNLNISPVWPDGVSVYSSQPYIFLNVDPDKNVPEITFDNNISQASVTTNSSRKLVYELTDSYVDESQADTNFGTSDDLMLYNYPGYSLTGLVKLDISAVHQYQNLIFLTLYGYLDPGNVYQTSNFYVDIYGAQKTDWGETDLDGSPLTWNNRPAIGDLLATFSLDQNPDNWHWISSDTLTNYINASFLNGDSLVSLYFVAKFNTGGDFAHILSREKLSKPGIAFFLNNQLDDLYPTANVSVNPGTQNIGTPVNLYAEYFSNSPDQITTPIHLAAYLSTDQVYGNSDDIELYTVNIIGPWQPDSYKYLNKEYTFDNSFTPGDYYILFVADASNNIQESNENNNVNAVPFSLQAGTLPDYSFVTPSVNPNPAIQGQQVEMSVYVKNQGQNITSQSFNIGVYLSSDDVLDGSDALLTETSLSPIDVGAQTFVDLYYTFSGTAAGNYYMIFAIDDQDSIIESDETNNNYALPFTLNLPPMPDYVPVNPIILPNPAPIGQQVEFTVTVKNQGHAISTQNSDVYGYLSTDNILDGSDINITAQGISGVDTLNGYVSTSYFTFDNSYTPGDYYIIFIADFNNQIPESDESNNAVAVPFTLAPPPTPDYTISSLSVTPVVLTVSDYFSFSWKVNNIGNADSYTGTYIRAYLSTDTIFDPGVDANLLDYYTDPLYQGASYPYNSGSYLPGTITPNQDYYIILVADGYYNVAESNESNNTAWQKISVVSNLPDLYLYDNYFVNPSSIDIGKSGEFYCQLYDNNGSGITNSIDIRVVLSSNNSYGDGDDRVLGTYQKDLFNNNTLDEYFAFDNTFTPGTYYIFFVIDPNNNILETDKTNNVYQNSSTVTINAAALPDLTFTNYVVDPSTASIYDQIHIYGTVKNSGNAGMADGASLGIYLSADNLLDASDAYLTGTSINALTMDQTQDFDLYFTFDNTFIPANYNIIFFADNQATIIESREDNNAPSVSFTLNPPPSPDYIIENLNVNPYVVATNGSFQLTGRVRNQGQVGASNSSILRLYFSTDDQYNSGDVALNAVSVNALSAGGSQDFNSSGTIPSGTYDGDYYIIGYTDVYNEVAEGNEANNISSVIIHVISTLPDLYIANPNVSPDALNINIGTVVALQANCYDYNYTSMSYSFAVGIYLSNDNVWNNGDETLLASYTKSLTNYSINENFTFDNSFSPGNYYLFFVIDDGDEINESVETNNVTSLSIRLNAGDYNPPVFSNPAFSSSLNQGFGNTNFSWDVNDDLSGVEYVNFKYRGITADPNNWNYAAMSLSSGSTYSISIPESSFDLHGLVFYAIASDNAGNMDSTDLQYSKIIITSSSQNINTGSIGTSQSNYRIISIPYKLNSYKSQDIFWDDFGNYDSAEWRLFSWSEVNQKYSEMYNGSSTLSRGRGYFLINKSASQFSLSNCSNPDETQVNPLQISLSQGWNLLGDPYLYNLSWNDILNWNGNPSGLNGHNPKDYEGGWNDVDRIKEFSGVFVWTDNAMNLFYPVYYNPSAQSRNSYAHPVSLKNSLDQNDWEVMFRLTSGGLENHFGGLGMRSDASELNDQYDDYTLPRFMEYLELNHKDLKFVGSSCTKDIVPTNSEYTWNFGIESSRNADIVTIEWDNSYFGDRKSLFLIDLENQVYTDMSQANSYSFRSNGKNNFRVIYSNPENATWAGLLEPAYPNPFTNTTRFGFRLHEKQSQQVQVNIFNSAGIQIHQLFNGSLPGGPFEMEWNGTDISGHRVPAGIYFIIFRVNSGRGASNYLIRVMKE